MILYHYKASPFAEKIRLMFGYAGLSWQSMMVSAYPPRKVIEAMLPGYRKIPIAQIGADLICDTALISEEIADACNKPELIKYNLSREDQNFVQTVELDVFFSVFAGAPAHRVLAAMLMANGPIGLFGFLKDRTNVAKTASVDLPKAKRARAIVADFLAEAEQRLSNDYFGGVLPNAVDFAVYHPLWALITVSKIKLEASQPKLFAWYERMTENGHGKFDKVTRDDCWQAAKQEPRPLPQTEEHDLLGKVVTIAPTDYAQDETSGVLVCATKTRFVLEIESEQFGRMHFHFPRMGYRLQ